MKKKFLSLLLCFCMALSLLPSAALATDGTGSTEPAAPGTAGTAEGTTTETSFVCGGCVIEFSKNGANPETYTATVRALTSEEATEKGVANANIGKLNTGNSWDGNGDWATAGKNENVAPYWATYKDVTTKVVIKNGVTSLGGAAFTRFDKVTSLVWDGDPTVTQIGSNFLMCSSIDHLVIPASVQSIGGYAFGPYGGFGSAPSKVSLGNPAAMLGEKAFAYYDTEKVLIEVTTDSDISNLLTYAETNGYRVKNLADFGEGTTENGISWTYTSGLLSLSGNGAMKDYSAEAPAPWSKHMNNIATVNIADGITRIGANAFKGAVNLTSIRFPQSVTSIGASAFEGTGLTGTVRVPATVSTIGSDAFKDTSATVYIYNGIWNNDGKTDRIDDTTIGAQQVVHYIYGANIGGSTYPRTTNVLLGVAADGTAYVDAYSNGIVGGFDWDGGYHYIEVAPKNDPNSNNDKSKVSPLYIKSTQSVWPHSGDVNPLVKKVVIGNNVVSLSTGLFAYCSNLTELVIRGQHLTTIGNNVFMGTSIENVNLPATVTSIGAYAFGQYGGIGKNPLSITLNCENTQIKFNGRRRKQQMTPSPNLSSAALT